MTTSAERPCARVFRDPVHFIALGFGSGCAPKAPGTFGTLAALPLYLLIQPLPLWAYLLLTVAGFARIHVTSGQVTAGAGLVHCGPGPLRAGPAGRDAWCLSAF